MIEWPLVSTINVSKGLVGMATWEIFSNIFPPKFVSTCNSLTMGMVKRKYFTLLYINLNQMVNVKQKIG